MRTLWFAAPVAAAVFSSTAASVADTIPGKMVIAKSEGDATVLYDATPEVAAIVHDKIPDAEANARLQRDALRVLIKAAPQLPDARTITVRVTYSMTGDVSPIYGSPTFAGIERYANLTISGSDAKEDRGRWKEAADGTKPSPHAVSFTVVGKLPPR